MDDCRDFISPWKGICLAVIYAHKAPQWQSVGLRSYDHMANLLGKVVWWKADSLPRRPPIQTELYYWRISRSISREYNSSQQTLKWWSWMMVMSHRINSKFQTKDTVRSNVVLKLCSLPRPQLSCIVLLRRNWEVGGRRVEVQVFDRVASLTQVKGNLASCRERERR